VAATRASARRAMNRSPDLTADSPAPSTDADPPRTGAVSQAMGRGIAWTGVQMVGSNLLSLAAFVVLGRILTPRDFGLVASATVVILFLRVLVDAGFSRLIVQRRDLTPEHIDTAFWTAIIMGLFFTVALAAAAPLVADAFGQPRLTNIVRALSLIFIFVSFDGTQSALLERRMEFRSQAIRRLIAGGLSTGAAIALGLLGAGVWALVVQQLVLEATTVLVLWTIAPWRPRRRFSRTAFVELAGFGMRYSASVVLLYLGSNMDNLLIALVLGPVELGYYVIAYRIYVVGAEVLVGTVNRVALTTFSRLVGDSEALNASFIDATTITAFITLPCFAALALLAHPFITLIFGAKWAPSVPVLQVLAVAGVVQGQLGFTGNYAIALGKMSNQLIWLAALVGVELAGFAATVAFGIVAVAASLSGVMLLAWPIRLKQVSRWRHLSAGACFANVARLTGVTGAMVAVMWILGKVVDLPTGGVIAIQLVAGAACYLGLAAVLASRQTAKVRAALFSSGH